MQYFHFLKIARLNAYYKETYNYSFQYLAIMIKVSLNKSIYNNFAIANIICSPLRMGHAVDFSNIWSITDEHTPYGAGT